MEYSKLSRASSILIGVIQTRRTVGQRQHFVLLCTTNLNAVALQIYGWSVAAAGSRFETAGC